MNADQEKGTHRSHCGSMVLGFGVSRCPSLAVGAGPSLRGVSEYISHTLGKIKR